MHARIELRQRHQYSLHRMNIQGSVDGSFVPSVYAILERMRIIKFKIQVSISVAQVHTVKWIKMDFKGTHLLPVRTPYADLAKYDRETPEKTSL